MASLNKKAVSKIKTHEGGKADKSTDYQMLRRTVLACMLWEDSFYEDGVKTADRIKELVAKIPNDKVQALAIEARSEFRLRHVPLLLIIALLAKPNKEGIADTIYEVIQRPDELTELLNMYWGAWKKPLPNQLKKGLAKAFTKFDAYQLAKYNRDNVVKLRDVMFLCHPKPKDDVQAVVWAKLADGTLESPDTWEVGLSTGGDKKEVFTRLLKENKLGYMALLRNLRNMQKANVDEKLVKTKLTENAKFSKALPFRFIAAAKAAPRFERSLDVAMQSAMDGLPKLKGKTRILIDHSGSMNWQLSDKSDLNRFDAATGLAILLSGIADDLDVFCFSTQWGSKKSVVEVPPRQGMALAEACKNSIDWGGTDINAAMKKVLSATDYDRLIVITDEQSSSKPVVPKDYKQPIYVINVANYKHGISYRKPFVHIDGFSEAVVKWLIEYESEFI